MPPQAANECWFAFLLFIAVTLGLVLQFVGLVNMYQIDSFCDFNFTSTDNQTAYEDEQHAWDVFAVLLWLAFVTEFIAFILLCARFVFSLFSVIVNMSAMIEFRVLSTTCVMSIIAFHYVLANFMIGTIKVSLYIAFLCKCGCPDTSKFLGSDEEVANYAVHTVRKPRVDQDGRISYTRTSRLVTHH